MENNFVDTSGADFAKQFSPAADDFFDDGGDFLDQEEQEENDNRNTRDNFNGNDFEELDDEGEYVGEDDEEQSSGNTILDSYIDWATEQGIDISKQNIDPSKFNQESMDKLVGRHYIQKQLGNVDPRIVDLAENGVNLDEYMEQKQYYNQLSQTDPVQLFKAQMYDHLLKSESAIGGIQVDQNGNPANQESVDYLVREVERRISTMNLEAVNTKGRQIQQYYKQVMNELPDHLVQQQHQKYSNELNRYNSEVDELTSIFKDKLSKSDNLVIDFSGQAEKDDFIGYMKENLSLHDHQGQKVVPLLYKLQNDSDFLATTMRLLHMHEKGYFTDMKNMERNAAFKKLSITPVLGKNNKSNQSGGAGKFVDTSSPNYQKKFKK